MAMPTSGEPVRRGMRVIKTMGRLSDARRVRNRSGALMELSVMANERHLLGQELARMRRRHVEIQARLAELDRKERELMRLVEGSAGPPTPGKLVKTLEASDPKSRGGVSESSEPESRRPAVAFVSSPPTVPAGGSVRVVELSY